MTKQHHILVVEDDVWLAEQHERVLVAAGYRVTVAHHALAAIAVLDAGPVDVMLLDVLLAGPNAFTLLHEIRSHEDLATLAVILCTNSAAEMASEDLQAYGVVRVLDKATMQPDDLVAAVRKVLL